MTTPTPPPPADPWAHVRHLDGTAVVAVEHHHHEDVDGIPSSAERVEHEPALLVLPPAPGDDDEDDSR